MITEPLTARLERLLPGAIVTESSERPPHRRFHVEREATGGWTILATASSEREAIERALFLWGARR